MKLIPQEETYLNELKEVLSKSKAFGDAETFITLYNSGFLNKSNTAIREVVERIVKAYKNVRLMGNQFIILSQAEISAYAIEFMIKQWQFVATLKRLSANMFEEHNYDPATKIVFSSTYRKGTPVTVEYEDLLDKNGNIVLDEQGMPRQKVVYKDIPGAERMVGELTEIANNLLVRNLVQDFDTLDGKEITSCFFYLQDIIDINDDFISEFEIKLARESFREQE